MTRFEGASATFIDFETGTPGAQIGNDFAAQGVVFRNFILTDQSNGPNYREHSSNIFATDQHRDPPTTFNITADFLVPVSMVTVDVITAAGHTMVRAGSIRVSTIANPA